MVVLWGAPEESRPVEFVTRNISQFGYDAKDIMAGNIPFNSLLHEEDMEPFLAAFRNGLNGPGPGLRIEYRIITKSGDVRWVEDRSVFHRDETGKVVAYQASLLDITDRKGVEASFRRSEDRLGRVLKASKISLWEYFPEKDATIAIGRGVLFGDEENQDRLIPRKELWDRVVPQHARGALEERLKNILSGRNDFFEYETETIRSDGTRGWMLSKCFPVRGADGNVLRLPGLNIDITRLKETELEIVRRNDRLALLHSLSLAFMEEIDTKELLRRILEKAVELAGTEHGRISVLEPGGREFRLILGVGVMASMVGETRPSDAGLAGEVLKKKAPVVIHDYRTFSRRIDDPRLAGLGTVIGLPLFQGGNFFGVLSVAYCKVIPVFDDGFLSLLEQFSGAASIALENARLYEMSRRELEDRTKTERQLRSHAKLVEAAAYASGALLSSNRTEDALPRALLSLGKAVNSCETVLFRNQAEADGTISARVLARVFPAGECEKTAGVPESFPVQKSIPEIHESLAKGIPFHGTMAAFGNAGTAFSSCCSSVSVTAIPIRIRSRFWGVLAFCFPGERGRFKTEEFDVLRAAAYNLAASVFRWESEERVTGGYEKLRKIFTDVISTMGRIVGKKDPYSIEHQERVAELAAAVARKMGLEEDACESVRVTGLVHDVGKIEIAGEILNKPGRLSPIEFELVKTHSLSGFEILREIEFPWPVAEITYQHHERMDGSGYPRGLKGDEILLEARILAVADVVESMLSHRPYRPSLGLKAAREEIEKNRGVLYDRDVVDACLALLEETPGIITPT
jgi:PAS domain S-box-containing protein/putative nucleotidyltransferase with HDIG domain